MAREYIDLGPVGWQAALPIMVFALENGVAEGPKAAKQELLNMAKIADQAVLEQYVENGDVEKAKRYAAHLGVEVPANKIAALKAAEAFIAGFEDDDMQEGVPELLAQIRKAMQ